MLLYSQKRLYMKLDLVFYKWCFLFHIFLFFAKAFCCSPCTNLLYSLMLIFTQLNSYLHNSFLRGQLLTHATFYHLFTLLENIVHAVCILNLSDDMELKTRRYISFFPKQTQESKHSYENISQSFGINPEFRVWHGWWRMCLQETRHKTESSFSRILPNLKFSGPEVKSLPFNFYLCWHELGQLKNKSNLSTSTTEQIACKPKGYGLNSSGASAQDSRATTAEMITHLSHPGSSQDTPSAVPGTSVTFTRPGWEGSGHLSIFHPQSITFCLAAGILFAAPAQEQMKSKICKQEELLWLAGTAKCLQWFTSVESGHALSHYVTREMDSWSKREVPVNSHLKVTWILYSLAI